MSISVAPDEVPHVVVIGAGYTGLTAALELARAGVAVTVLEAEDEVGGLAGTFDVGGERLEKFYHHWFTNDQHVNELVRDIGAEGNVLYRPTRTGMWYANSFFKLSTPMDLLRFTPLSMPDRIRLGLLALRARRVRDWRTLEHVSAEAWLRGMGGARVWEVVWKPLLEGKFGTDVAPRIGAVWFWNKLKLRGGSRGKGGQEYLAYYKGGFAALAEAVAAEVRRLGGEIRLGTRVDGLVREGERIAGVRLADGTTLGGDAVLATVPLPVFADLVRPHASSDYVQSLGRIEFLANTCVVLELDRSLSDTYWLNVSDPSFPFVGIIEHTNFEPASTYGGRHIVYLSKYHAESHPLFTMSDAEVLDFCVPYITRMFPAFDRAWVTGHRVWRARWSQPIVVQRYGELIPAVRTPLPDLWLATMAQVYPEDRGTNYAIREGRAVGRAMVAALPRVRRTAAARRAAA